MAGMKGKNIIFYHHFVSDSYLTNWFYHVHCTLIDFLLYYESTSLFIFVTFKMYIISLHFIALRNFLFVFFMLFPLDAAMVLTNSVSIVSVIISNFFNKTIVNRVFYIINTIKIISDLIFPDCWYSHLWDRLVWPLLSFRVYYLSKYIIFSCFMHSYRWFMVSREATIKWMLLLLIVVSGTRFLLLYFTYFRLFRRLWLMATVGFQQVTTWTWRFSVRCVSLCRPSLYQLSWWEPDWFVFSLLFIINFWKQILRHNRVSDWPQVP